jgi:hypothetical protein
VKLLPEQLAGAKAVAWRLRGKARLHRQTGSEPAFASLVCYELARLPYVRALAAHSRQISADYRR